MSLKKILRYFKRKPFHLILQLDGVILRFILCDGDVVFQAGELALPFDAVKNRIFLDIPLVRLLLLERIGSIKGVVEVSVLLPHSAVYLEYFDTPKNLDFDEFEYQIVRQITKVLNLPLSEVYYDWAILPQIETSSTQTILLILAHQVEVAQYGLLFSGTNYKIHHVIAEPLIWSVVFPKKEVYVPYAVCHFTCEGIRLDCFNKYQQVYTFQQKFNVEKKEEFGFDFTSNVTSRISEYLPDGFVTDELVRLFSQVQSTVSGEGLRRIYVFGSNVYWSAVIDGLQVKLDIPVHELHFEALDDIDNQTSYISIWALVQYLKGIHEVPNLWSKTHINAPSPKNRLIQEALYALLVSILIFSGTLFFMTSSIQQVMDVNTALTSELETLQMKVLVDGASQRYSPLIMSYQQPEGHLNWLAVLPSLVDEHAQITQVIQKENGFLTIQGHADSAESAQALIERASQVFNQSALSLSFLKSKKNGEVIVWLFEMQVNDVTVLKRLGDS